MSNNDFVMKWHRLQANNKIRIRKSNSLISKDNHPTLQLEQTTLENSCLIRTNCGVICRAFARFYFTLERMGRMSEHIKKVYHKQAYLSVDLCLQVKIWLCNAKSIKQASQPPQALQGPAAPSRRILNKSSSFHITLDGLSHLPFWAS